MLVLTSITAPTSQTSTPFSLPSPHTKKSTMAFTISPSAKAPTRLTQLPSAEGTSHKISATVASMTPGFCSPSVAPTRMKQYDGMINACYDTPIGPYSGLEILLSFNVLNPNNVSNEDVLNQALKTLLDSLRSKAVSGNSCSNLQQEKQLALVIKGYTGLCRALLI